MGLAARLDLTGKLTDELVEQAELIAPLVGLRPAPQMGVDQQVAPPRIEQSQHQIGDLAAAESAFHLAQHRTARAGQFLLALRGPHRAFDIAAIGADLPVDQRVEFVDHLGEHARVVVVLLNHFLQQIVDPAADLAVDAVAHVLGHPEPGELIEHQHRAMRFLRFAAEKLGIAGGQLVEGDLQAPDPLADAVGQIVVRLDGADQALHDVEGVVILFTESLVAMATFENVRQTRLEAGIVERRALQLTLDHRQRIDNVILLEGLVGARIGRRQQVVARPAAQVAGAALQVQHPARCRVGLDRPRCRGRKRVAVDAAAETVRRYRCLADRSVHVPVGLRFDPHPGRRAPYRRPRQRFPDLAGAGKQAAGFEQLSEGRVDVAEHGHQGLLEIPQQVLSHLAPQIRDLQCVVERPGDDRRTDRVGILVRPGLGDQAELGPDVENLLRITSLGLGDDLRHAEPFLELHSVHELELAGITGLAAAALLEYLLEVGDVVHLPQHFTAEGGTDLFLVLLELVEPLAVHHLDRVGAGVPGADQQFVRRGFKKLIGDSIQRPLQHPVHFLPDFPGLCITQTTVTQQRRRDVTIRTGGARRFGTSGCRSGSGRARPLGRGGGGRFGSFPRRRSGLARADIPAASGGAVISGRCRVHFRRWRRVPGHQPGCHPEIDERFEGVCRQALIEQHTDAIAVLEHAGNGGLGPEVALTGGRRNGEMDGDGVARFRLSAGSSQGTGSPRSGQQHALFAEVAHVAQPRTSLRGVYERRQRYGLPGVTSPIQSSRVRLRCPRH